MRAVIQRVQWGRVSVDGEVVGQTGPGVVVLLGVLTGDTLEMARGLAQKVANLRIFPDADDKMNCSLLDMSGGCLVVSQFTLYADCKRGRRPYFGAAEEPGRANELCEAFTGFVRDLGVKTETGLFGAMMQVELSNDGPVTIILDSTELGIE